MWYPTDHMLGLQRNGVNHAGMEGSSFAAATGPIRDSGYPRTTPALLDWYRDTMAIKSVRLLICWEAVQSGLSGQIPVKGIAGYENYWKDLVALLNQLIDRHIRVILCPLQHNPASGDTDIVYRGASFTKEQFGDFWGKLAKALNAEVGNPPPWQPGDPPKVAGALAPGPSRVAMLGFDLINEPHDTNPFVPNDIGISPAQWQACAQQAINAIRADAGNINTIFIGGMGYAAVTGFAANGSAGLWLALTDPLGNLALTAHCYDGVRKLPGATESDKPVGVLRNACAPLVQWAREHGFKVHIGEIALDAGIGGCGSLALAQQQWADWTKFCLENDDILIGWNWWGSTDPAVWNWDQQGSCDDGRHWGFALAGPAESVYASLIKNDISVPELYLRDNAADGGAEPNVTTPVGFESPDIWVRQGPDGGLVDMPITGGLPSTVYVRVRNRGKAPYPGGGQDRVALYWAKASTGLGWPSPWDGSAGNLQGGWIGSAPIDGFAQAENAPIPISWTDTPNPLNYGGDGHFCLLAVITKNRPESELKACKHDGFEPGKLNQSVLKLNNAAWHNIHVTAPVQMNLPGRMLFGDVVMANPLSRPMLTQLAFDVLDSHGRRVSPGEGRLLIAPDDAAARKLSGARPGHPGLEAVEGNLLAVQDPTAGLPPFELEPGKALRFGLTYAPDRRGKGWAVRAIQYQVDGATRRAVGGQTFVAGAVVGFTAFKDRPRPASWRWAILLAALLVLILILLGLNAAV